MLRSLFLAIWLLGCSRHAAISASDFVVESVAGTGAEENNGKSGPTDEINVEQPFGVEIGPDGALYITEVLHHRIRRLDLTTRELTTVAGNGQRGYSGDRGAAVAAELNEPYEVRFDAKGNMFFVEMKNHIVRRVVRKSKTISTIAGTGQPGYAGDGGPATKALLNHPHSISIDDEGAIYIADIGNHRIRRVDPQTGEIETIAGNERRALPRDGQTARGNAILGPRALCVDGQTLWIALREGHSIWRMNLREGVLHHVAGTGEVGFTGDGGSASSATFNGPKGIAVGPGGDVYVADSGNNAIRRIDNQKKVISTVVGPSKQSGVGNNLSKSMNLNGLHGICVASDGTALFIGDTMNHRVLRARHP